MRGSAPHRLKLLVITHYFEDHRGGVEIVAGRMARELAELGMDVTWAATGETALTSSPGFAIRSLVAWNGIEARIGLPFPILSPGALRTLVAAVREADAVLIHDALYLTSIVGRLAAAIAGKPVLIVQHIGEVAYSNPLLRWTMRIANRIVTRPMLASAAQVVFISETTRRYFQPLALRPPAATIFNGVENTTFRPAADEAERLAARRELSLDEAGPVALFVGRFVEKKGLHWLQRLAAAAPDVAWAFAGWGPIDPASWNLPNVRVFRGRAGADLATLYRAANAFVLPSTGEGFPLVVQEALASGLPVVCGQESAEADAAASHWLHGVELDETDPAATCAALLAAVRAAIDSPAKSLDRHAFARHHYSWRAGAERYAELIGRMTRRPGAVPATATPMRVST